MKKVLAELHELINELEDNGLTAEASTLQEVFVRVAQEADPNDLSEQVKDLLDKYSAPELIAALAEQMDSKDTKTMSFAFGEEPDGTAPAQRGRVPNKPTFWRTPELESQQTAPAPKFSRETIIERYVIDARIDQYGERGRNAYNNLAKELGDLGYDPLPKEEFDKYVRTGLVPQEDGSDFQLRGKVPPSNDYDPEDFKREMEKMNKKYEGGWGLYSQPH